MKRDRACDVSVLVLFLFLVHLLSNCDTVAAQQTPKPIVKRPEGTKYKTLLSIDGASARGLIPTMVMIEIEQSIKRYLLAHPELLPPGAGISSVNDFDISLADYFDCITGVSSGTFAAMYLASLGGQGASRAPLDDPAVVEEYGVIPTGSAEGLRVFYREYSALIYPPTNASISDEDDPLNPSAPGVSSPLFPLEGAETAFRAFLGESKLSDVETSLLVSAHDLVSGLPIFFVQNAFRDPPVSSTGTLLTRTSPQKAPGDGTAFHPDFIFDEDKDYFLSDIAAGATAAAPVVAAKQIKQTNNDTVEFILADGIFPVQYAPLYGSFFVARENQLFDFENIAVLSLAAGIPISTLAPFRNAGAAGWLDNVLLASLFAGTGQNSADSLMDYIFYANPYIKPNQYLRVQFTAPLESEEGMALSSLIDLEPLDVWETIGIRMAEIYRDSIDAFVHDFIFG